MKPIKGEAVKGEAVKAVKSGESAKERASIVKMATNFAGKIKATGEAAEAAKPLKIKSAKGEAAEAAVKPLKVKGEGEC